MHCKENNGCKHQRWGKKKPKADPAENKRGTTRTTKWPRQTIKQFRTPKKKEKKKKKKKQTKKNKNKRTSYQESPKQSPIAYRKKRQ